jgi:hypothetical protein
MILKNDEILINGHAYNIPFLLGVIADKLRGENPTPISNPVPTEPTRFSIHWEMMGGGKWLGFLVGHWEYQCEAYNKTHTYNPPILQITVTANGAFHAKCIPALYPTLVTSNTFEECKKRIEDMAFAKYMMDELYPLCVKEDANPDNTIWWK